MKLVYWPDGQGTPANILFNKDWVHPTTNVQAGRVYYDRLTAAERAILGVYIRVEQVRDPNKTYSEAWVKDPVNGTATLTLTEVGFKNIDRLIAKRLSELDNQYKSVIYGGVVSLTKNMPTDQESLNLYNTIGSAIALGSAYPPAGVAMITVEGGRIKPNAAQFNTFMTDVATHMVQALSRYDIHYDTISALVDPQAIIDYDINTGWPANPVIVS